MRLGREKEWAVKRGGGRREGMATNVLQDTIRVITGAVIEVVTARLKVKFLKGETSIKQVAWVGHTVLPPSRQKRQRGRERSTHYRHTDTQTHTDTDSDALQRKARRRSQMGR